MKVIWKFSIWFRRKVSELNQVERKGPRLWRWWCKENSELFALERDGVGTVQRPPFQLSSDGRH